MNTKYSTLTLRIASVELTLCRLSDFDKEFAEHFEVHKADQEKLANPPLYGLVWPAAEGLAWYLHALGPSRLKGQRVLEIGCGLALPSLICAGLGAQVTAMDKHADAGYAVLENSRLNGLTLSYRQGGFDDSSLDIGTFDWIIGSDILYEPDIYPALESFIMRHAAPEAQVLIADPGRYAANRFGSGWKAYAKADILQQTIPGRSDPIQLHRFQFSAAAKVKA